MILGIVTADREATIELTLRGFQGQEQRLTAVVDTGFDGSISLPSSVIQRLGFPWRQRGRAELADGSECIFDIFDGAVLWDGLIRSMLIDEAETVPLVGMRLLDGHELNMQIRPSGPVSIRRLD